MARLLASRPRLAPILLSLAAHALLLAPLWLWRGKDAPPPAEVLDTRIEVSLAEPPPLPEASRERSAEGDTIRFSPGVDSAPPSPFVGGAEPSEPGPAIDPSGLPMPSRAHGGGVTADRGPQRVGADLLAAPGRARKVVYVLDHSVSMGLRDALVVARREVLASVRRLPPDARFQVIAYNEQAEPLWLGGRTGLVPVEPAILEELAHVLDALPAAGESHHLLAVQRALALQPDLLYLVTDADELTLQEVHLITRLNQRRAVIHTLELSERLPRPGSLLGQLASANGGTYRCVAPRP